MRTSNGLGSSPALSWVNQYLWAHCSPALGLTLPTVKKGVDVPISRVPSL